jgi:hypothetical protein
MRQRPEPTAPRLIVLGAALALTVSGCVSGPERSAFVTTDPAGTPRCTTEGVGGPHEPGVDYAQRCPGPAAIPTGLGMPISVSADGRTVTVTVNCGGQATATETSTRVTLRYVAAMIMAGGASCPRTPISVQLAAPLGTRELVDARTGQVLVPDAT